MLSIQDKVNRLSIIGIDWMGPDQQYIVGGQYSALPDIEPMTDDEFDQFCTNLAPQLPTVIDKSMEVFKDGSMILRNHEIISSKALAVGRNIDAAWEEAYAIPEPEKKFAALAELDARSNKYLVNVGTRLKDLKDARAPLTQLMNRISSLYTSQENMLDRDNKAGAVPAKIQARRNQYAKDLLAEEDRKKKEAAKVAAKNKEAVDLRAWIKNAIGQALVNYQASRKMAWTKSFNEITLANIEEKSTNMANVNTAFPASRLRELIFMQGQSPLMHHHNKQEEEAIYIQEWDSYDFQTFYITYGQAMADLKKELQDKLPSKLEELQEQKRQADKAEQDRLDELERQRIAREAREKAEREATDTKEKERLRLKGIKDQQDEQARLDKIQKENQDKADQLLKDQQDREAAETLRLQRESERQSAQVTSTAELGRVAGHSQVLFQEMADTTPSGKLPSSKKGFEIKVLNLTGWVEIFTFWFERIGVTLSVDDMGKKGLDQMKKDVEAIAAKAQKNGKVDQITSKNLIYEDSVKARNVKEKTEKSE